MRRHDEAALHEGGRWLTIAAFGALAWLWITMTWAQLHVLPYGTHDGESYWRAAQDFGTLYDRPWNTGYSFVYSPAFAQLMVPFGWLPLEPFYYLWTAIEIGVVVLLAGPVLAVLLLVAWGPVQGMLYGNIDAWIGLAIAVGLRYPGAWAFVLLTKVTPGIGLLWYVVRREWKPLVRALAVTGAIVTVSFVVAPHLWVEWVARLAASPNAPVTHDPYVPVTLSFFPRLLLAAGITVWGARTNRPWTLLVAAFVASGLPTSGKTTILLGILPLVGWGPLALRAKERELERRGRRFGVDGPARVLEALQLDVVGRR